MESHPTGRSNHSFMKKAITILLLCAVAVACLFAEDALRFEPARFFDSITIGGGFSMHTATVKAYDMLTKEPHDIKSQAMGPGAGIAVMTDLSAIPEFLKEGWFGYCDVDVFFPAKVSIGDKVYDAESGNRIAFRTHMGVLRRLDFGIPVRFYLGAGFSYGIAYAWQKLDDGSISDASSQAFGAGLLTIAEYAFSDHFAVTVTVTPDFTFLSTVSNAARYKGTEVIMRYCSAGFGFGLTAKAGIRYIF